MLDDDDEGRLIDFSPKIMRFAAVKHLMRDMLHDA